MVWNNSWKLGLIRQSFEQERKKLSCDKKMAKKFDFRANLLDPRVVLSVADDNDARKCKSRPSNKASLSLKQTKNAYDENEA